MLKIGEHGELLGIDNVISIICFRWEPITVLDTYCWNCNPIKHRPYNDVFGLLNPYYSIKWKNTGLLSPEIFTHACLKSYSQICDERMMQLANMHQHLTILWSGGCDSCTMVTSAIRNNLSHDKYTVLCTERSVWESPKFYEFMLKSGIDVKNLGDVPIVPYLNTDTTDTHYLNGCPGCTSPSTHLLAHCAPFVWRDWHDGIFLDLENRGIEFSKREKDELVGIFEGWLYKLGVAIWHTYDFVLLYLFSGMYLYEQYMFPSFQDKQSRYIRNNTAFYQHYDFAHWALTNILRNPPTNTWIDFDEVLSNTKKYRPHQKAYIKTVFDDPEIDKKQKVGSQTDEFKKYGDNYVAQEFSVYYDDDQLIRIHSSYQSHFNKILRNEYFNN